MKIEICGKEILRDSQCINYKYYHNDCIENLQEENKKQKEVINRAILELANIDGTLSNGQLSDRICNLIDTLKEVL